MEELSLPGKVVGVKQSRKAIEQGRAAKVYLADDADPVLLEPLAACAAKNGIPVERGFSMAELGRACHITVGAAVAAVLKANG